MEEQTHQFNDQIQAPEPPVSEQGNMVASKPTTEVVHSAPTPSISVDPNQSGLNPVPVVKVLSPRGIEYVFLSVALISGAFALAAILLSLINSSFSFSVIALPVAALVVSVPIFSWLFLREKRAESTNPELKLDASKRRVTKFMQILSFFICFFTLIGLVYSILSELAGNLHTSLTKIILDVLVVEVIAGGILFYYWRDEHLKNK